MHPRCCILIALTVASLELAACGRPTQVPARELEVPASGVTLHVRIAGNPNADDVLLAVGMGPGLSSHYMVSLEQLAGESFAVVTYDQRGTGRSAEPTDGYGLGAYIADLEAVRQAVGAAQVHLFGHCWGGLIATQYAALHPEHVRSLVIWGGAWPSSEIVATGQQNLSLRHTALQKDGVVPARPTSFEQVLPVFLSDPTFDLPDEFRKADYNPAAESAAKSALGEYDFTAEVARLDHRVLLLWGEGDPFGLVTAGATRDAFQAARLEFIVIEDCGHLWQECSDVFLGHLRTFLTQPPV